MYYLNRIGVFVFCLPVCLAQTHDLSAGFRYEMKLGQNSYHLGNSPGYALRYAYRPLRWFSLETGLEQIPRPIGGSVCCEYLTNAADELFLVPFGARFVWEPQRRRLRLSAGGGGAYLNHAIGHEFAAGGLAGTSGWGAQFVAAADYALTRSGRWRAGATARYYYVGLGPYSAARVLTAGPDLTFSFR